MKLFAFFCRRSLQAAWVLLVGVCASWLHISAQTVILPEKLEMMTLGEKMTYFVDSSRTLQLHEIRLTNIISRFQPSPSSYPNIGSTSDAVWYHVILKNPHAAHKKFIFEAAHTYVDSVSLYTINRDTPGVEQFNVLHSGSTLKPSQRPIPSSRTSFILDIPAQSSVEYFIRIQSSGDTQVTMVLFSEFAFWSKEHDEAIWFGCVYGIMLFALIYAFILAVRHQIYFIYIVYIVFSFSFYLSYDGIIQRWIWLDIPLYSSRLLSVAELSTGICVGFVLRSLFNTSTLAPRFDTFLLCWMGVCFLSLLMCMFNLVPLGLTSDILSLFGVVFAVYFSYRAWKNGLPFARLYLLGWIFYVIAVFYTVGATTLAFLPYHPSWVHRILYAGAALETVFFVLAIADSLIFVEERLTKEQEEHRLSEIRMQIQLEQTQRERDLEYEHNIELARSNSELVRLHEEKNEFLGIVAHDLKSPLSGIIGVTEMLMHGEFTHEQQQSMGSTIHSSAVRMFTIVKNILDQNALETGRLQITPIPIEIMMLVYDAARMFALQAEAKNIHLVVEEPQTELPQVWGDASAILQILENLISNAIKYSPFNSSVNLIIQATPVSIQLIVRDEGPGLSEEDKRKLFIKFERLSPRPTAGEDSTGLGLSIVKKLVDAMHGSVLCESELGKGTAFIVELPIAPTYS